MKRRASLARWLVGAGLRCVAVPAVVLLGLLGCVSPTQEKRAQSEEDPDRDRYEVKTVGDISTVGNAEPTGVGGLALVGGLDNTGGETLDEDIRHAFEDQLRKKGVKNIKELMTSPEYALVMVSGVIPPGARKGDSFDVDVALPAHTRATSLRGGILRECVLFNYDMANHLLPKYTGRQGALKGYPYGKAHGPVIVGMGEGEEEARAKQGRVWAGGRAQVDMPLILLLNPDYRYGITSQQIAGRINELFQSNGRTGADAIALADKDNGVLVRVPAQYRLNVPRFLRVVRLIPHQPFTKKEAQAAQAAQAAARAAREPEAKAAPATNPEQAGRPYRQRLADDLLDPARTVVAALRLEALGTSSIPLLQEGLKSKDGLVRFCSAEALAYLGHTSAADELALAVAGQPMLRAFGLTALASLDEAVAQNKLEELLSHSTDDETRYGAFRALRARDETNPTIQGNLVGDAFWVHEVARDSTSLVHLSTARRAEIVLFGPEPVLLPPFSLSAGEFIVTATSDDERCTVSRVPLRGGETERRQCALKLTDLLRTLADLGAQYSEVIALLKEANGWERLTSRVRLDALPQATTVMDLAHVGKGGVPLETDGLKAIPDLGATPTLYENARAPRSSPWQEDNPLLQQNSPLRIGPNRGPEGREAQRMTPGDE